MVAFIISSECVYNGLIELYSNQSSTSPKALNPSTILMELIKSIVFPLWFMRCAVKHAKKRLELLDISRVQIVEMSLSPKLVLKEE